ncbi:RNA polymerase sigma factor [Saccharopolyspora taberi]|uniref:Sigma factor-like helix-turn-helix DNA-binding protein n=1 Tax=Saccharopolyspora taberi TaxID=60895 RepID=A0ABN3V481_9PSEU
MTGHELGDLLRGLAPQVLGVLVRRHGQFDACEDAVQEALLAAAVQWPEEGVPAEPVGWLVRVAGRRLTDLWRSESARRRREQSAALGHDGLVPGADEEQAPDSDDTLALLFLCCHPELSPASQVALTLRAVGGLTTAQIAHAFMVPEATMTQRITRAKQRIRDAGATFRMPAEPERTDRLRVVLHVLYLIFNEGYTATAGPELQSHALTGEAIRLARELHRLLPADGEVSGLLALMLITDSRRAARVTPDGVMIPLAEQDRDRWDRALIAEGTELIGRTLAGSRLGPYQVQAAIAAVHAEAPSTADTDWRQVLILYRILDRIAPNPVVTLNRAIATAMVHGPAEGIALLSTLDGDRRVRHRIDAVRAHLLELAGDRAAALDCYRRAARATLSIPERRYLESQAAKLAR